MLRKKRRNDGPQAPKRLVTNRPDGTARQVVEGYRRRWTVELRIKALQGATGLGQHPVTTAPQRVERSIAMAVMADLGIVTFRAQDSPKQGAWSLFTRKQNFTWPRAQGPLERAADQQLRKARQEREAA